MNFKKTSLLIITALLTTSCGIFSRLSPSTSSSSSGSSSSSSATTSSTTTSSSSGGSSGEVTVPAHTLSDTNPPINIDANGDAITKSDFDNLLNAPQSYFNGHYNYTYTAYTGSTYSREKFTKNGYSIQSSSGTIYYEKKNGSTFYVYAAASTGGYLREETTLNLQEKYTYRIWHEVYTHLNIDLDFNEDFEYNEGLGGAYVYNKSSTFNVSFIIKSGYLVYLHYSTSGYSYYIAASFETTIDIPKSYYVNK